MSEKTNPEIDVLTGCLTRRAFERHLEHAVDEAQAGDRTFSLGFIDIDHFKAINDEFGHVAGDEVLQSLVTVLRQVAGEEAILGRYGGDEFAVLFPSTERETAFLTMERLRQSVASFELSTLNQARIKLTISAGLATFPIDGRTDDELLRSADAAIYRAKVSGRDRIRLAFEDRMVPKTAHFTQTQLERLAKLAEAQGIGEAVLLREALDDLLIKYGVSFIER